MPSGMAAWEHWHTFGEAERKRERVWDGVMRHRKKTKGSATDKGKATLSCRRDRSPATVIVMRAWLALADVLPAAFVFKWSCLPLPGPAKVGQDGLGTRKIQQPEIVAGADSRLRVLYPAAFPCQMETKKGNG